MAARAGPLFPFPRPRPVDRPEGDRGAEGAGDFPRRYALLGAPRADGRPRRPRGKGRHEPDRTPPALLPRADKRARGGRPDQHDHLPAGRPGEASPAEPEPGRGKGEQTLQLQFEGGPQILLPDPREGDAGGIDAVRGDAKPCRASLKPVPSNEIAQDPFRLGQKLLLPLAPEVADERGGAKGRAAEPSPHGCKRQPPSRGVDPHHRLEQVHPASSPIGTWSSQCLIVNGFGPPRDSIVHRMTRATVPPAFPVEVIV